jgi:hypothetical protein
MELPTDPSLAPRSGMRGTLPQHHVYTFMELNFVTGRTLSFGDVIIFVFRRLKLID